MHHPSSKPHAPQKYYDEQKRLTLRDDGMDAMSILPKGSNINLPNSLRSLVKHGLIELSSFSTEAMGKEPARSGLRITRIVRDEPQSAMSYAPSDTQKMAQLLHNLFPHTRTHFPALHADETHCIEITHLGALQQLFEKSDHPLAVDGMPEIIAAKLRASGTEISGGSATSEKTFNVPGNEPRSRIK